MYDANVTKRIYRKRIKLLSEDNLKEVGDFIAFLESKRKRLHRKKKIHYPKQSEFVKVQLIWRISTINMYMDKYIFVDAWHGLLSRIERHAS